jgi:sugar phosphate isomerase/epimerase
MAFAGYDVPKEIRRLGDRICQIHMKEQGCLLGQGKVDFPKIRDAIAEIGYRGWLIIEGATVKGKTLEECYIANREFLQKLFA